MSVPVPTFTTSRFARERLGAGHFPREHTAGGRRAEESPLPHPLPAPRGEGSKPPDPDPDPDLDLDPDPDLDLDLGVDPVPWSPCGFVG